MFALPVHLLRQILVDLWWILGAPWDQLWSHVDDLFVILTTQLQCGFQTCYFCDLGVDMAPGCDAEIYSFGKVIVLGVPVEALGLILGGFGRPRDHLFSFWGHGKEVRISTDFRWFPGGAKILRRARFKGKSPSFWSLLTIENCRQQTEISNLSIDNC